MLYQIIETKRGKETVKMVDCLQKCNRRLAELRNSSKGKNVTFRLEESLTSEKFESEPLSQSWRAGDYAKNPRTIK